MNKAHTQTLKASAAVTALAVAVIFTLGQAREGAALHAGVQQMPAVVVDKSAESAARLERLVVLHRGW